MQLDLDLDGQAVATGGLEVSLSGYLLGEEVALDRPNLMLYPIAMFMALGEFCGQVQLMHSQEIPLKTCLTRDPRCMYLFFGVSQYFYLANQGKQLILI